MRSWGASWSVLVSIGADESCPGLECVGSVKEVAPCLRRIVHRMAVYGAPLFGGYVSDIRKIHAVVPRTGRTEAINNEVSL